MPYIKELILKGFKSFASETKIPFDKGMNVIVGPNGSGKSNIADAICFVLGRLSMKSMRAARISNLIFSSPGSKPAYEASVKIIFDNSDRRIPLNTKEVSIERVIRRNGQSVYKINDEVKTRQEVIDLLASFGIDPYGFNIILQDEITNVVKVTGEERRKIIEEVSGISIYEQRKEKSLNELKKTEEKLRVAEAILRDRHAYLKNLEEERKQALKYQELQELIKRLKASILSKKIKEKEKERKEIIDKISKKEKKKEELRKKANEVEEEIGNIEKKIEKLDFIIQKNTGVEQEKLYEEITELKSILAGLEVKKKNYEERIEENKENIRRAEKEKKDLEEEIKKLLEGYKKEEQLKELENEKRKLESLEKERNELYNLKLRYKVMCDKINQIKNNINKNKEEALILTKEIEKIELFLTYNDKESCLKEQEKLRKKIEEEEIELKEKEDDLLMLEKEISFFLSKIKNLQKIKNNIHNIKNKCPLCQSKITPQHSQQILKECDKKIKELKRKIEINKEKLNKLDISSLKEKINKDKEKENILKIELMKIDDMQEKKDRLRKLIDEQKLNNGKLIKLEKEAKEYENKIKEKENYVKQYNEVLIRVQELSTLTERDIDSEVKSKRRELERIKNLINQTKEEIENLEEEIENINEEIERNSESLMKVEEKEEEFIKRNKELLNEKNRLQQELHNKNKILFDIQNSLSIITNEINELRIDKARIDAEIENLIADFKIYENYEIIEASLPSLQEKLERAQQKINEIGEVNILALKKYEEVKSDYDKVYEKVDTLRKEKESIMKIIEEIDRKKTRTFMKTLKKINELFNRNFTQLSQKGQAFLKLENEENPFEGGLDIIIRVAKGKYFDVSSLSGGEKTLIAISLIFAIQEYKPYPFYIFDEIDAALDKRNSERLAILIKRYMKNAQYIIITHNDAIIEEAGVLYGVSMQDGKSRIFSLKI